MSSVPIFRHTEDIFDIQRRMETAFLCKTESFWEDLTIPAKADIIGLFPVKAFTMTANREGGNSMKNLDFVLLLDCYGGLLTERQRDLLDGYYNEDLSLAELASPSGISRQAVHDSIRRGERQLLTYEEQLGLAAKLKSCRALFEEIEQISSGLGEAGEQIAKAAKDGIALL